MKKENSKKDPKAKPGLIPVRLGLTPEQHYSLRLLAAHANMTMTDFVKSIIVPILMGERHERLPSKADHEGEGWGHYEG